MIRRLLALAPAFAVLLAAGAAGASGRVAVSTDGRTWTPSLTAPLFDPAVRWAPGDSRTAEFGVRNLSTEAGTIAVVARVGGLGSPLARDVRFEVRRGTGSWMLLVADGRPHQVRDARLAAGADAWIAIRARFAPSSANASQLQRLPLAFDVVLGQASTEVAGPTPGGHGQGPGGALPSTGGVERAVLIAGLLLLVAGAAVVRSAMYPSGEKDDDERTTR